MEREEILKTLDQLIAKNTPRTQMIKMLEELHELHHAISRFLLYNEPRLLDQIIEEFVDVNIMMMQLEIILVSTLGNNEKTIEQLEYKINKIKESLNEHRTTEPQTIA